jgi:hypothetical protein
MPLEGRLDTPRQPDRAELARRHARAAGARYLAGTAGRPVDLPEMPRLDWAPGHRLTRVPLPDWAGDLGCGEDRALLVDASCLREGGVPPHERCDWLLAAFLHLDCWLERSVEREKGPIQSFAMRLDSRRDRRSATSTSPWHTNFETALRM